MTVAEEPSTGSYVSVTDRDGRTRVYKRVDWLAGGRPDRWFWLTGDNPHGLPDEDEPVLTWVEVLALGPFGYVGKAVAGADRSGNRGGGVWEWQ